MISGGHFKRLDGQPWVSSPPIDLILQCLKIVSGHCTCNSRAIGGFKTESMKKEVKTEREEGEQIQKGREGGEEGPFPSSTTMRIGSRTVLSHFVSFFPSKSRHNLVISSLWDDAVVFPPDLLQTTSACTYPPPPYCLILPHTLC